MAKDFRTNQIRSHKIVGSGSMVGSRPSLMIYSASSATDFDGTYESNMLTNVGGDAWMFISGSPDQRVLFGGDVTISGTIRAEKMIVEVDEVTTGSLWVSGSLVVSQSATIYEGLVVNETGETGAENDTRIETGNKTHAFFVDASADQVLILSGGDSLSANESAYPDLNFFVSGAIDSKGTSTKGTAVFGGDVMISGSLVQGDKTVASGNKAVAFGGDSSATGDFSFSQGHGDGTASGAGSHVEGFGSAASGDYSHAEGYGAGSVGDYSHAEGYQSYARGPHSHAEGKSTEVVVGADGGHAEGLNTTVEGDYAHAEGQNTTAKGNYSHAGGYFTIASGTHQSVVGQFNRHDNAASLFIVGGGSGDADRKDVLLVNGSSVLILSGGGADSIDEAAGADVAFYISGTIGSQGTSVKGASVFGGDVIISGNLVDGGGTPYTNRGIGWATGSAGFVAGGGEGPAGWISTTGSLAISGTHLVVAASIMHMGDDDTYISFGNDIFSVYAGGKVPFQIVEGYGIEESVRVGGFTKENKLERVLILSGGDAQSPDESAATDMSFFVSGAIGSKDSTTKGTALFGGDLVVSGGLHASSSVAHSIITTKNAVSAILLHTDGGTSEQIKIHSDQGTGVLGTVGGGSVPSIYMLSDDGGIGLQSNANLERSVFLLADGGTDSQVYIKNETGTGTGHSGGDESGGGSIRIHSKLGGIEMDGAGEIGMTAGAAFYVSAGASSEITTDAGTLTLEGQTGVIIQEAGTAVITISDAKDVTIQTSDDGSYGSADFIVNGFSQLAGGIATDGGNVVINELGANYDFRVESDDHPHMLFVDASENAILIGDKASYDSNTPRDLVHIRQGDYTKSAGLRIEHLQDAGGTLTNSGSIIFSSLSSTDSTTRTALGEITMGPLGDLILSASKQDTDIIFRTNPDGSGHREMMRMDGGTGQVLILSGGHSDSVDGTAGGDVNFFVSGTIGAQGTSTRGTAVFGGDVVVSGTLYALGSDAGTAAAAIGSTDGGTGIGNDAHLWVSGAIGSQGTSTRGTAIFGGDVVISGSLTDGAGNPIAGGGGAAGIGWATGSAGFVAGGGLGPDGHMSTTGSVAISGSLNTLGHLRVGPGYQGSGWINVTSSIAAHGGYDSALDLISVANPGAQGNAFGESGIYGFRFVNNGSPSGELALRGGSQTTQHEKLRISNDTAKFFILSGADSAIESPNEWDYVDTAFFVSGAIGSKGTSVRGTSVFGGDLCASGSVYTSEIKTNKISGSLTRLVDGTSYLIAGSGITITSGTNGALTIDSSGGGGSTDDTGWIAAGPSVISTTGSVFFGVAGGSTNPDITFGANGAAIFNLQQGEVDFRVASVNKPYALFVSGNNDQVLILSGSGNNASLDEAAATDVNFFVSGSAGSASSATRGTALFGGDLVTSGTILPGSDLNSDLGSSTRRFGNIYTGDLHLRNDRGNWTIVEEPDYLCVINNLTGKKFKMALIPLEE